MPARVSAVPLLIQLSLGNAVQGGPNMLVPRPRRTHVRDPDEPLGSWLQPGTTLTIAAI